MGDGYRLQQQVAAGPVDVVVLARQQPGAGVDIDGDVLYGRRYVDMSAVQKLAVFGNTDRQAGQSVEPADQSFDKTIADMLADQYRGRKVCAQAWQQPGQGLWPSG